MSLRFHDGDRVCFIGDSITAANEHVARIAAHYHDRYPHEDIRFYNNGVSGCTLTGLLQYFNDDVAPRRPTHAVVMLAVNDAGPWLLEMPRGAARFAALKERYDTYCRNLEAMYQKLKAIGAEMILCTPVPYAEYEPNDGAVSRGCYAMVAAYAAFVRDFARTKNCPLCEIHDDMAEEMQKQVFFGPDRTHPNAAGQYHMAKCFLAFQGETIASFAPIPPAMDVWRENTRALRSVYEGEWNVLQNYALSTEEKMAFMQTYLDEKRYEQTHAPAAFERWTKGYLKNKPMVKQLFDITENIW